MNMAWFETAKTKINRGLILKLLAVAASDGEISDEELAAISEVGRRVGFGPEDIKKAVETAGKAAVQEPAKASEKMAQLEQCVLVMIADGKASQKEMQTCSAIAHALGLDPAVSLPAIMDKLGIELRQIDRKKEPAPTPTPTAAAPFVEISGFGLSVPQGKFQGNGYVALYHNQVYTLRLSNMTSRCSDARIHIDGKDMGLFRLVANTVFEIEHPTDDTGCFTFYELGSSEGTVAGIKANDKLGVVEVTFYPEKPKPKARPAAPAAAMAAPKGVPAVGGLDAGGRASSTRGKSNDTFLAMGAGSYDASKIDVTPGDCTLHASPENSRSSAPTKQSLPAGALKSTPENRSANRGEKIISDTSDSGSGKLYAGTRSPHPSADYDGLFEDDNDDAQFDPTGLRAGGTGLSGESQQPYIDAERIEYDLAAAVTISLRLAAVSLNSATPRPLKSNSNRVPPPLS